MQNSKRSSLAKSHRRSHLKFVSVKIVACILASHEKRIFNMKKHFALFRFTFSTLVMVCWLNAIGTAQDPAILTSEFIYEQAPFPQCHASTIAESKTGLIAAWFGGQHEKNPDVGIWVSRQVAGHWTAPVEVANGIQYVNQDGSVQRHPCWNPVLFQPEKGPLLLFYKVGPSPSTWWGMLTSSEDGGESWTTPRRLPERIDGPVKNKPIELADGRLLCPSSTEDQGWRVHFEITTDLGISWVRSDAINDGKKISAIQPSILRLGGEHLLALGRTREGKIFQVASLDAGRSWGELSLTDLPNPNSGIDAVTLDDGRHLLIYNHTSKGRSPLNIAVSTDGAHWQAALVLESESGEYSYPAIIQSADGKVHATYTWLRQRVKHVEIDPAKIQSRDFVQGQWPK
jgi:predicted neuraminidase